MTYLPFTRHLLFGLATLLTSAYAINAQTTLQTNDIPRTISYQGVLSSRDGALFTDGNYRVTVTLYADEQGMRPLWTDSYATQVTGGVFNLYLGSDRPLPDPGTMNAPLWIGTSVDGGDEMRPLTPLSASPYALNVPDKAITSAKLADESVTAEKIDMDFVSAIRIDGQKISSKGAVLNLVSTPGVPLNYDETTGSVTIGRVAAQRGTDEKGATLLANQDQVWSANGDCWDIAAAGPYTPGPADWIGTTASDFIVKTGGTQVMNFQVAPIPNIIGGDAANIIAAGAVMGSIIAEGSGNTINGGDYQVISGGQNNTIGSGGGPMSWATIGGGQDNVADATHATVGGGRGNTAAAPNSTIGGGDGNHVATPQGTIAGGFTNNVHALLGTIAGGYDNVIQPAGDRGFIGGGHMNQVNGPSAAIGGGESNTASGQEAFVGGGNGNGATGPTATVGGGQGNFATAPWGTIAGGQNNNATSSHSFVGGGENNMVNGSHSFIGGGLGNTTTSDPWATIGGGMTNMIANASMGTIGGGEQNTVSNALTGTIGGGRLNTVSNASMGTIGGGEENSVLGTHATIPGGDLNTTDASYAQTVVGFYNAIRGATVAFRPTSTVIAATNYPLFMVGNGDVNTTTRSNAFEVSYNGHSTVFDRNGTGSGMAGRPAFKGATYVDNITYAWGNIDANGTISSDFGVASVTHVPGSGIYTINFNYQDPYGTSTALSNVAVTANLRTASGGEATCGIVTVTYPTTPTTSFIINTFDMSCRPTDYPFVFHMTGRP